jgi:hypothetical protein
MCVIVGIARRDCGAARSCDCRYHRVKLGYRTSGRLSARDDLRKHSRGILVEGEDPALEVFRQEFLDDCAESRPALAGRQELDSIKHFRLGDRGDEYGRRLLRGKPA